MLVNNGEQSQQCEVVISGAKGAASKWDCETGMVQPLDSVDTDDGAYMALAFNPLEAYWVVFDPEQPMRGIRASTPDGGAPDEAIAEATGAWKVVCDPKIQPMMEFPSAPPAEFATGVERSLADWKTWGFPAFSGLLEYSTTVTIDRVDGTMVLDLGKVAYAAEVWVNDVPCGMRLWAPYTFDVTKAAKTGRNVIRVRVANLINNSYGDVRESGLLGPVRILLRN